MPGQYPDKIHTQRLFVFAGIRHWPADSSIVIPAPDNGNESGCPVLSGQDQADISYKRLRSTHDDGKEY